MRGYVHIKPIVDRIIANTELERCGVTSEAVELLLKACSILNLPKDGIDGKCPLRPEMINLLAFVLGDVLDAVQVEVEEPTTILRVVSGGRE